MYANQGIFGAHTPTQHVAEGQILVNIAKLNVTLGRGHCKRKQ